MLKPIWKNHLYTTFVRANMEKNAPVVIGIYCYTCQKCPTALSGGNVPLFRVGRMLVTGSREKILSMQYRPKSMWRSMLTALLTYHVFFCVAKYGRLGIIPMALVHLILPFSWVLSWIKSDEKKLTILKFILSRVDDYSLLPYLSPHILQIDFFPSSTSIIFAHS